MKKILKLSRSLSWALLAIMALQAPGSAIAMEQEQPLSQRKQSLLRRLVANYTETRELHRKRKAGKASPEELKKLEERMKSIKKAAIKAGVIAAFIAAIFGAKWAYGKYQTAQEEKQKAAAAAAAARLARRKEATAAVRLAQKDNKRKKQLELEALEKDAREKKLELEEALEKEAEAAAVRLARKKAAVAAVSIPDPSIAKLRSDYNDQMAAFKTFVNREWYIMLTIRPILDPLKEKTELLPKDADREKIESFWSNAEEIFKKAKYGQVDRKVTYQELIAVVNQGATLLFDTIEKLKITK